MTIIQEIIERIEEFSFVAYGKTYDYEALGFELEDVAYDFRTDEISFELRSEEHGIHELWEILEVHEVAPYTVVVTNLKTYGLDSKPFGHNSIGSIIEDVRDTVVAPTPEAHTI